MVAGIRRVLSPQYSALSTQYLALAAVVFVAGCDSTPDVSSADHAEPSLAEQIIQVRSGASDRILIEETPLSDANLIELAGLVPLRELLIDHPESRITPEGLQHLADLPKLEHLRIRGGGIGDAELAEIARITSLQILNLPQGEFSDEALKALQDLPDLIQLRFGSPHVTDEGMKTLAEFPALTRLHLIDVPITDAGLAELAKIERLQSLYIDGGSLSDQAWEKLFRERPKLHVHVNQQHHDRDPHRHSHE